MASEPLMVVPSISARKAAFVVSSPRKRKAYVGEVSLDQSSTLRLSRGDVGYRVERCAVEHQSTAGHHGRPGIGARTGKSGGTALNFDRVEVRDRARVPETI